jgi:hypothetical protein
MQVLPILVVALGVLATVPIQDNPEKARMPKKGDTVVVKGCLEGQLLRSVETSLLDESGRMATPLTYRLKGDRKLLHALRSEHDGRVVEVTGELKSTLPIPAGRGVTVGKSRIVVGIGAPPAGNQQAQQPTESLPVVEVKTYEGMPVACSGS